MVARVLHGAFAALQRRRYIHSRALGIVFVCFSHNVLQLTTWLH